MKRTLALVISAAMLVMAGTAQAQDQTVTGNLTVTGNQVLGLNTNQTTQLQFNGNATASPFMSFYQSTTRRGFFQFQDSGKEMKFCSQYGNVSFFTSPTGSATNRTMTVFSNGNVGFGSLLSPSSVALAPVHVRTIGDPEIRVESADVTGSPKITLQQNGNTRGMVQYDNATARLNLSSTAGGVAIYANNAAPRMVIDASGNIGVGTATPTTMLTVAGETTTNVINITGGSDLAEQFQVRPGLDKVEPGMVVCIDAQHPGELKVSGKAYDKTVAGIVSGANGLQTGMRMGQTGSIASGAHAIALTGRVYCKVDTSRGAIEPGDLLTTSAKVGHAMKASDVKKSQGAIIGKAMTGLEAGKTGMVLVLVNLQ